MCCDGINKIEFKLNSLLRVRAAKRWMKTHKHNLREWKCWTKT